MPWDNSILNTTQAAGAFARVLNSKTAQTFAKVSPFIGKLFSELDGYGHTPFEYNGQMVRSNAGGKGRLIFQGDALTVTAVSNPAAAAASTFANNAYGAVEFPLTRLNIMHQLDIKDREYIAGSQAAIDGYFDREADRVLRSLVAHISTQFHGTGDQTVSTVGSFARAIQTDDTLGTYLGITRASTTNVNLDGQVIASAAYTTDRLRSGINLVTEQGGEADLALLRRADFETTQTNLATYHRVIDPKMEAMYGGKYINYLGCAVCMDGYLTSSQAEVLSTPSWHVALSQSGFSVGTLTRDVTKAQIEVMPVDVDVAIVTENPRKNCRIIGV